MRSRIRPLTALGAIALVALVGLGIIAGPASAAPPFPDGTRASALVGSPITVVCPDNSPGAVAGGTATINGVTVSGPAGARCAERAAAADGQYTFAGFTGRFQSDCESNGGFTNGFVDTPTGPVTAVNTPYVYPNGTTAILNEVVVTPTSVTRTAIRFTSGPAAGTRVGQVVCGAAAYPLAVDVSGAAQTVTDAVETAGSTGTSGLLPILAAAGIILAVLGHLTLARRVGRNTAA